MTSLQVSALTDFLLACLAFNVLGLRRRSGDGHWTIVLGILVLLLASAVQALGIDTFSPVDRNGLYHLISMPGVVLLYFGGRRLKTRA